MRQILNHWCRLGVVCVLSIGALAASSAPTSDWSQDDAAHLLRRAGFGGTPQQIDRLHALGREAAVECLLSGKLPDGAEAVFAPVSLSPFELTPPPEDADRQKIQQAQRQDMQRLRAWWVDRMLRTDHPLEEKMTLFWHGLFTSGAREVKSAKLMAEQNALFHREAIGNYKRLAEAIVHDGAMLRYLDAAQNVKGKPNENLARELMELFTMGEGNGYSEQDIAEAARALTGLAIAGRDQQVMFRRRLHDEEAKTIFGRRGNFGPEQLVGLIFARPEPSKYLAKRLWEFFAYPNPSDADLAPVIRAIKQSNYETSPALRAIFTSSAFYSDKAKFALIKSPTELAVGTMRLLERESAGPAVAGAIAQMGQQLLQPPNVRGWPGGEHWITTATLYTRYNVATTMVEGGLPAGGMMRRNPGKQVAAVSDERPVATQPVDEPRERRRQRIARTAQGRGVASRTLFPALPDSPAAGDLVDAAIARFLQRPLSADKRDALVQALGAEPLKLGEESSERRVRGMIGLLLSSPEYQLQ